MASPRPGPSSRPTGRPVRVPSARVALSTSSVFPGSCADAFAAAARLGYDGVEVMVWTDAVSQDVRALAKLRDHYGMPVVSVHAPTLLVTHRVWGVPWEKIERSVQMAAELGAGVVVVHPPFRWQREYAGEFTEGVRMLSDEYGVAVAVENMYPWRLGNREVMAYAPGWDPIGHGYDHVTLDLSHTATAGSDALAMARDLGPRLRHLHLADGSGSPKDEHLVPGTGTQPCDAVLGLLAEMGWSGSVVAEINTRRYRTAEEREDDLARTLAFARLHLAAPPAD